MRLPPGYSTSTPRVLYGYSAHGFLPPRIGPRLVLAPRVPPLALPVAVPVASKVDTSRETWLWQFQIHLFLCFFIPHLLPTIAPSALASRATAGRLHLFPSLCQTECLTSRLPNHDLRLRRLASWAFFQQPKKYAAFPSSRNPGRGHDHDLDRLPRALQRSKASRCHLDMSSSLEHTISIRCQHHSATRLCRSTTMLWNLPAVAVVSHQGPCPAWANGAAASLTGHALPWTTPHVIPGSCRSNVAHLIFRVVPVRSVSTALVQLFPDLGTMNRTKPVPLSAPPHANVLDHIQAPVFYIS